MKIALSSISFNEQRFIKPFLAHIPLWVNEKLVLVSTRPWNGEPEPADQTAEIARDMGATVIEYDWKTEAEQRNAGQDYLNNYDWIIVMDPDEFLDHKGWNALHDWIRQGHSSPAGVVKHQRVFWKNSEVFPHTDYQQIILVKPTVKFTEARVVDSSYVEIPLRLYHFSWARTDRECWRKISHYSHANQMDIKHWYKHVWLADKKTNLHPNTPETLKALVPAKLPPELEELNLWPR